MDLEERKGNKFDLKKTMYKVIGIIVVVLVIGVIGALAISHFSSESKTTKIGFEDIGELDTQVAHCTVVDVIDDPRKIFNITIPFTDSKCIYSYDVVVKAGLNFSEIKWDDKTDKIVVTLPEPHITDSYIVENSGKIYLEEESIFSPITMEEEMEARSELVKTAEKDAIANGLFDHAKQNAELLLSSLFKQHEEYAQYDIEFNWEKGAKSDEE